MKLCKTPLNGSNVNGRHESEVGRHGIRDRKMTKESRDSRRKDGLITSHRIFMKIYKGEYEVRGEVNKDILNEG